MTKKLCLLLLGVILAFPVFCQSQKGFVYLKNGSILKGKYAYFENMQKLKVETAGNTWIFSANEVDSVSLTKNPSQNQVNESLSDSKFFYRTELGALVGNPDNTHKAPFSASFSANYTLTPRFSAGVGVGIELFKEAYMPTYANFEYKLRAKSSSPYVFLKVGYQIPLENDSVQVIQNVVQPYYGYSSMIAPFPNPAHSRQKLAVEGGWLINPGFGYQQMFTENFGMNFAMGYQFHRLNFNGENNYLRYINYHRLTVKIGIVFN